MLQLGKMQILEHEMDRVRVDTCRLSEIRWQDQRHFHTLGGHMVVYSGDKKRGLHDAAIWMHKKISETITSYEPTNERTMVVLLYAKPKNITLIQAYTPTAAAKEEVVEVFYEDLERVVKSIPKSDIMIMTGDFKGKVGKQDIIGTVIGLYGLSDANDAGEHLREFCEERELALVNTWFKKHSRPLYTWKSPDGLSRNHIDYIAIDQNWKTIITDCTTYPGADCDTKPSSACRNNKAKTTQDVQRSQTAKTEHGHIERR